VGCCPSWANYWLYHWSLWLPCHSYSLACLLYAIQWMVPIILFFFVWSTSNLET